MNWGKGIVLGMGAFMTFITVLVILMFKNAPTDFDRQYYEKGLAYDSVYVKEKQVITDNAVPHIGVENNVMQISFTSPAIGTLHFERPEDAHFDRTLAFKSDGSNRVTVPLDKFITGQWQLTFEWENQGKKYIYDREMYLP